MCNINNINFKCIKHQKDFLYYKNLNYYCSECLKESESEDYLNLDFITLSKNEIEEFKKIIIDSENIIKNLKLMNENYIKKIRENFDKFNVRNQKLIKYCKDLLNFNEKFDKNFNLISTIRGISKTININELTYNNLINFYDKENIIKFNNEFKFKIYFESENILKKGQYYLGECINKGTYGEVFKALSIKDKKIVAIKNLNLADEQEFINEINILKKMNNCENSVKYLDSFKEKNDKFIVTELCDGNLRNLIQERKYGLNILEIKKIFSQLNACFKELINKKLLHREI